MEGALNALVTAILGQKLHCRNNTKSTSMSYETCTTLESNKKASTA